MPVKYQTSNNAIFIHRAILILGCASLALDTVCWCEFQFTNGKGQRTWVI